MPAWVLYLILLPLTCLVFNKKENYKYIPFLFLTIVCMFRYDMVTDYAAYLQEYYDIKNSDGLPLFYYNSWISDDDSHFEVGFILLNKLFGYVPFGWVFLFAGYIAALYYLIYKELERYDVVCIGTLIFILLNFINYTDNVIRQSICIALFLYSYRKFICQGKFLKFLIIVLIGATIHSSMLFTIILYPFLRWIPKCRINTIVSFIGIIVACALTLSKATDYLLVELINVINYRGYIHKELEDVGTFNSGYGFVLKVLIYSIPYYLYIFSHARDEKYEDVFKIYYFYIVYLAAFNNIWICSRLLYYLMPVPIIAISLLSKLRLPSLSKTLYSAVLIVLFIWYASSTVNYYGDYHYKTVFCEDARLGRVYNRGHVVLNRETDRNSYSIINK